jgi:hypothetical protein
MSNQIYPCFFCKNPLTTKKNKIDPEDVGYLYCKDSACIQPGIFQVGIIHTYSRRLLCWVEFNCMVKENYFTVDYHITTNTYTLLKENAYGGTDEILTLSFPPISVTPNNFQYKIPLLLTFL